MSKFDNETILYMIDSIKNHITKKSKPEVYDADDEDIKDVKQITQKTLPTRIKKEREQYKCACGMLLKNKSGVPFEMHNRSKFHLENTKETKPSIKGLNMSCVSKRKSKII